jgi:hypothetical protein
MVTMAQENRDIWYSSNKFTKPYPGDRKVKRLRWLRLGGTGVVAACPTVVIQLAGTSGPVSPAAVLRASDSSATHLPG